MTSKNTAIFSAVTGAALVLSGVGAAAPLAMADEPAQGIQQASEQATAGADRVDHVEGLFSFDQATLTDNAAIKDVFARAAATLCTSMPEYGGAQVASVIDVATNGVEAFSATVDEMKAGNEADSYTMGCACATNMPGGGAIANAEVSGVSVESIAAAAAA